MCLEQLSSKICVRILLTQTQNHHMCISSLDTIMSRMRLNENLYSSSQIVSTTTTFTYSQLLFNKYAKYEIVSQMIRGKMNDSHEDSYQQLRSILPHVIETCKVNLRRENELFIPTF